MLNWFKRKSGAQLPNLKTDIHSHLLPGLDDGVKTLDEAYEVILYFQQLGYEKLITTPHVMEDVYRNSTEDILIALEKLKTFLVEKDSSMQVQAAAEYYLDEGLMKRIDQGLPLLTFGKQYLLFETNFLNEPLNLKQFIFQASTRGYKVILAHPERYMYLHKNFAKAEDLLARGVQFQINISSLTGYYSKQAQVMANELIDRGWVHWLASDCHHMTHARLLKTVRENKYFQKALNLPLLNNTL